MSLEAETTEETLEKHCLLFCYSVIVQSFFLRSPGPISGPMSIISQEKKCPTDWPTGNLMEEVFLN